MRMRRKKGNMKRLQQSRTVLVAIALTLIFLMLSGLLTYPAAADGPTCSTSGTTVELLGETCGATTCTWEYKVCQTGFGLSHWVLGRCDCFEGHIVEVGINGEPIPQCDDQAGPCWSFGLDPTTGLFGLKWDDLPGPENESWTFYLKIDADLGTDTLDWTSKFAACPPGTGSVAGPVCPCGCGEILAFKYYDVDKNGGYNEGDYELQGWQICLDGNCKTTDEFGFADFGCQDPDTYQVCETLQSGWINSQPGLAQPCYTVALKAGEQVRLEFGNYEEEVAIEEKAYIRGSKYYDYNQNEVPDDDYPLNDWEICLGDECKVSRDICMLCGGCTDYWEVAPGTYKLCEKQRGGWLNSDPGLTPPCKEVTVKGGEFRCMPFGNYEPVPVGGVIVLANKLELLGPWIGLAVLASIAMLAAVVAKKRKV
jgi:hypothetical protein